MIRSAPRSCDALLAPLHQRADSSPMPLFPGGSDSSILAPGVFLHRDKAGQIAGGWHSPAGRLIEITVDMGHPGRWCALHLDIGLKDLTDVAHVGLILRSAALPVISLRAAIRSGSESGFSDCFFDCAMLSESRERDHHDMLAPPRRPEIPVHAAWRELVLFLPPAQSFRWVLHDLRVFVL